MRNYILPGDHLESSRVGYEHHGIFTDRGDVIHVAGDRAKDVKTAEVRRGSLEDFAGGHPVRILHYGYRPFDAIAIVRRAESQLGRPGYSLISNNCEHFARWCVTGRVESVQVTRVTASGVAMSTLLSGGLVVAALGTFVATDLMGAAATTKTLSAVGGLVGGGPTAGIALLGAGIGAAVLPQVNQIFGDDPFATAEERAACAAARGAAIVGLGVGTVGSLGLVAAAGAPGLSAVGVTSGLKALGGLVGGGMGRGVVVALAVPAAIALTVAFLAYNSQKSAAAAGGTPAAQG